MLPVNGHERGRAHRPAGEGRLGVTRTGQVILGMRTGGREGGLEGGRLSEEEHLTEADGRAPPGKRGDEGGSPQNGAVSPAHICDPLQEWFLP